MRALCGVLDLLRGAEDIPLAELPGRACVSSIGKLASALGGSLIGIVFSFPVPILEAIRGVGVSLSLVLVRPPRLLGSDRISPRILGLNLARLAFVGDMNDARLGRLLATF